MPPRFDYRGFMFDLDGTVYLGERLLPGAQAAVAALRAAGRRLCFLSNKPIASRADYAAKLTRLGIPTDVEEVINSSYVLARWLDRETPGARVFVIGEPPLIAELEQAGLKPVEGPEADWVVVAFDRTFDYRKLDVALQAVTRHGARLVGTNPDRTCPVEGGEIPDAAGMIGAVEGVTGRKVEPIVGKPSPITLAVALERLGLDGRGVRDRGRPAGDRHRDGQGGGAGHDPGPHRDHARGRPGDRPLAARPRARRRSRTCCREPPGRPRRAAGRRADRGRRHGGGRRGARAGPPRALVPPRREGRLRVGDHVALLQAHPRGLRYLELFDFGLVRESLRERETLARLAPHLTRPLPFLAPVYRRGSRSLIKVRVGMRLYDWLTPGKRTPRYRTLSPAEALALEPTLRADDLAGAGYYFDDLLLSPERLCLENVLSARRAGATALNYAQAEELRPRSRRRLGRAGAGPGGR